MKSTEKIFVKRVKLSGYKSIENIDIELVEGLNIIIGKNAVGKTNFLSFLNKSLNLDFDKLNNFRAEYSVIYNKKVFDFSFSKTTSLKSFNDDSVGNFEFLNLKKLGPSYNGKLSIYNIENTKAHISEIYGVENENENEKLRKILMEDKISIKSILIKHGLPNNYYIIDKPLNIELINKDISDDFINLFHSNIQSNLFRRLLFTTLTPHKGYFNKRLKKQKSIEKFIKEKAEEYKKQMLKRLSFLDELKIILAEYSPIENLKISENFLIDIDIDNEKITLNNFFLEYKIDNKWYQFNDLSDGTKRIFYIISEVFILDRIFSFEDKISKEQNKLNVVLIEEPELGIHPHQLYDLMRYIKEKSRDEQIIITTHSPQSLDILEKKELSSIIVAEKKNNATHLKKLTSEKIEKAKLYMDELNLSDFWLNSDLED
ncbi:AAA family ATPase [Elizabethkingia anophelis]|uniref:AAA family ATPase n=1 Tax=Elizabethkingia anophelis TaxID=1117645 RepID=UPI001627E5C8|nr:ATP-binding protein [Elizabethkingia anophelis]MCT4000335.1 AAA family ATPase [Elizabethkingia anophelis]MCT4014684.1 AAA family ATPase [Elizabethkingia anophelis]MCT4018245.1 AAA family ATPase [Elizabethkingia anophelis]CAH1150077.1 hypothetical protein EAVVTKC53_03124 [Elizabethkingia anophelis]CAI9678613.1 hypothetical protein EAVVTKC53_00719 [Elizabethkingia anophelis]